MKFTIIITAFFFIITSCNNNQEVDFTVEREKILELHNAQRDYHFNKDSIAFANMFAEDFVGVGKGLINTSTKVERITRYHKYFSAVEFVKWDDVTEPIIKFSDDGSLAYTLVDKLVVLKYKNQEGEEVEGKTHYAWSTIYRKHNDTWKIESVTSTDRPVNDSQ